MTNGNAHLLAARSTLAAVPASLRWLVLGIFVVIAAASLFLSGPVIQVDEGSYLLSAAKIAGNLQIHGVFGYYSGYSLALVPAFWIASDPDSIYHVALLINAILVATTPFALYGLTRRLYPSVELSWHVAAAAAATCHASVLLLSQHTMSENALVPLYAWLLATSAATLLERRIVSGVACGCIGAMLFLVHPRGGAMSAAVLIVVTLPSIWRADLRKPLAAMWAAAVVVGGLHFPLEHLAAKHHGLGAGYEPDTVMGRLTEPATWIWIALNFAGSATEAVVASFGVLPMALVAIGLDVRSWWAQGFRPAAPRVAIVLSATAGLVVALLMSAVFFVPPQRADQITYGRYALPAVLPLLAIGILQFSQFDARRRRVILVAILLGLASIAVMTYAFTRLPAMITSGWIFINAPLLYLAQFLLKFEHAWFAIGACFLTIGVVLCLAAWRSGRAAVVVFVLANLVVATEGWSSQTWRLSKLYSENRRVIEAVKSFEPITGSPVCVELSPRIIGWHGVDFRWRLLNYMADYRSRDVAQCARAMIDYLSDRSLESPSMRLVATERPPPSMNESVGLFVEPGSALAVWDRNMPAVPTDSFYPVPDSERRAELMPTEAKTPLHAQVGDLVTVSVKVTNGSQRTWASNQDGPFPILLGARAFKNDNVVGEYRARFSSNMKPGASSSIDIKIGPFDEPGVFRVNVGVLQEKVAWFPDRVDVVIDVSR